MRLLTLTPNGAQSTAKGTKNITAKKEICPKVSGGVLAIEVWVIKSVMIVVTAPGRQINRPHMAAVPVALRVS